MNTVRMCIRAYVCIASVRIRGREERKKGRKKETKKAKRGSKKEEEREKEKRREERRRSISVAYLPRLLGPLFLANA